MCPVKVSSASRSIHGDEASDDEPDAADPAAQPHASTGCRSQARP